MKFHVPLLVAAGALCSALPTLVARDSAAVIDAVNTIATQMTKLNTTVTSYKGGLFGTLTALNIEFESIQLSQDLKDAIKTTTKSANFTDAESLSVSSAFLDLEPKIFSTLDNIVSKKPQFDKGLLGVASLGFLVKSNLQQEKDLSAQLGAAVVAKLSGAYASIAPILNQQIADKFAAALKVYS